MLEQDVASATFRILSDQKAGRRSHAPVRVAANRSFVLGDNRDHANDSRHWGTVLVDDILGRATAVYLSCMLPTWRSL